MIGLKRNERQQLQVRKVAMEPEVPQVSRRERMAGGLQSSLFDLGVREVPTLTLTSAVKGSDAQPQCCPVLKGWQTPRFTTSLECQCLSALVNRAFLHNS